MKILTLLTAHAVSPAAKAKNFRVTFEMEELINSECVHTPN
jgi:hypothetical protein